MSSYQPNNSGYNYGAPPPSSTQPPYSSVPYAAPRPSSTQPPYSYVTPPPSSTQPQYSSASYVPPLPSSTQPQYSSASYVPPRPSSTQPQYYYNQASAPYGGGPPTSSPSAPPYAQPPPSQYGGGYPPQSTAFAAPVASAFPPGSDPNLIACFQIADRDRSGFIDDKELQAVLSSYNQSFSLRTVHLLMYTFTNTNTKIIGPKEFTSVFYSLQNWRSIFERFDRDRSGRIDVSELRDALLSLGFSVSSAILELLVSKFDKSGGKNRAIEYDNFIECCLTVKGLTEKFKEKDTSYTGSATFTYETFMMTVLPFLIA